jgi:hypothetical protein
MGGLAPWAQVLTPLLLSLVGIPPYSTVHEPLKHKLRGDYKKKFLQKIYWISDLLSEIFILPKILKTPMIVDLRKKILQKISWT